MQEVCEKIAKENEGHAPGMTAVIGLSTDQVKEIANGIENAYAANLNSDKQTVVSGTFDALEKVEAAAKEVGMQVDHVDEKGGWVVMQMSKVK